MHKFNTKKIISCLIAMAIAVSTMAIGFSASAAGLVAINSTNFSDANFRDVVSDWYDEDGDGYLSQSEVSGVTLISISGMLMDTCGDNAQISNLKGIEFFTDCKRLRCGGIGLTTLDVSQMPQLIELTCAGNELTSLNLASNTNLQWLNCSSNSLTALDVTKNTSLTKLECYVNSISELNVSNLPPLSVLRCQRNELTSLNVASNPKLQTINCANNHLADLDLSANALLTETTNAYIGNQVITATAFTLSNSTITVPVVINNYRNIISTSLDTKSTVDGVETTQIAYDGAAFNTNDADKIIDGIDYSYRTGLANAESMDVHVNVERNFYQVKYYTDSTKQTLIKSDIVFSGLSSATPMIVYVPQCKSFGGWSESTASVTRDMEVYVIWNDDHNMDVTGFKNGVVTINCTKCGNVEEEHEFEAIADTRSSSRRYVSLIDRNHDGAINGIDFAMLLKQFKNK